MGDMSIPLQFAYLFDGQEVFMQSDYLLDFDPDILIDKMVFA